MAHQYACHVQMRKRVIDATRATIYSIMDAPIVSSLDKAKGFLHSALISYQELSVRFWFSERSDNAIPYAVFIFFSTRILSRIVRVKWCSCNEWRRIPYLLCKDNNRLYTIAIQLLLMIVLAAISTMRKSHLRFHCFFKRSWRFYPSLIDSTTNRQS